MGKYRKAAGAGLAGAIVTVIASVLARRFGVDLSVEEVGAAVTIVSTALAYALPNAPSAASPAS